MSTTAKGRERMIVLHRIPYKVYAELCRDPINRHVRMTYYDGTLEIMAPALYEHEHSAELLGMIVRAVAGELRIPCKGSGSTTFRRGGESIRKGKGKEPDRSYYIGNLERVAGKKTIDLDAGDAPPDLWIEVDHRGSSHGRLPVYAALGVPEVWRYRVKRKSLTFLALSETGDYRSIDQSLALPMLTPSLVQSFLITGEESDESEWDLSLRAWVRASLGPDANPRVSS
jgi:Uma2 family endonuclease